MSDSNDNSNVPSLLPPPDPAASTDLRGGSGAGKIFAILFGVVAAAGIAFALVQSAKARKLREKHAAFITQFKEVEDREVGPFWACLFGPNVDPGSFSDNLALGNRLEGAFAGDPLHFPDKCLDDCIPKLKGVPAKAKALDAPDEYAEALEKYGKSVDGLGEGLSQWAGRAKLRGADKDAERKILDGANAFHAVSGKPSPEAIAYTNVLRCVEPGIDKMADAQPFLQMLFGECKKPEFVTHLRKDCGKLATATDGKDDAQFKALFKKLGADDRDVAALTDCFKKSRKGEKQDDLTPFEKAWATYMESGGAVRKIGKEAMKND